MAPLKFRAWDPEANLMGVDLTLDFLASLPGHTGPHLNIALCRATKLGLVVMQSTGLAAGATAARICVATSSSRTIILPRDKYAE